MIPMSAEPQDAPIKYSPKSFSIDPGSLGMVTPEQLNASQGKCIDDFLRMLDREVMAAMGVPREYLDAEYRREKQLRAIMGEEFVEDCAHAPGALAYWRLIAAQT